MMQAMSTNSDSVECLWMKPPATWKRFQMQMLKAYAPMAHKFAAKMKGKDVADLGLPIYRKSKTKMSGAGMNQAMAMMPTTINEEFVSEISTKAFDLAKFQIPKGYRKVSPPPWTTESGGLLFLIKCFASILDF